MQNFFYCHYVINTFESVWGTQAYETIKLSHFTGKSRKADGHFFGACIPGSRAVLVCGGEQRWSGGKWVCSCLEWLSEDLRTEVCKGGDGVLLNCLWTLKPGCFSSAWCLVEEETNFVPHLLLRSLSAVHWAAPKELSLSAHCSCMSRCFQSSLGSIFHDSFFLCFPFYGGEKPQLLTSNLALATFHIWPISCFSS